MSRIVDAVVKRTIQLLMLEKGVYTTLYNDLVAATSVVLYALAKGYAQHDVRVRLTLPLIIPEQRDIVLPWLTEISRRIGYYVPGIDTHYTAFIPCERCGRSWLHSWGVEIARRLLSLVLSDCMENAVNILAVDLESRDTADAYMAKLAESLEFKAVCPACMDELERETRARIAEAVKAQPDAEALADCYSFIWVVTVDLETIANGVVLPLVLMSDEVVRRVLNLSALSLTTASEVYEKVTDELRKNIEEATKTETMRELFESVITSLFPRKMRDKLVLY